MGTRQILKIPAPPAEQAQVSTGGNNQNKENQKPTEPMQMTSQLSPITRNKQIDNISVEQIATSLGSNLNHLVKALVDMFTTPQYMEEQDILEQESQ